MFRYILDREIENLLSTATRTLTFPDGTTRKVEAYRLCWLWYDRILGPFYGHDRDELHGYVLKCMEDQDVDEGEALKRVLDHLVCVDETKLGVDYTDDPFVLNVAKAQIAKFEARKATRKVALSPGDTSAIGDTGA